jgi:hypothetical protein
MLTSESNQSRRRTDRLDRRTARSRLVLTESLFANDPWLLSEAQGGHGASAGVFAPFGALVELPIIRAGFRPEGAALQTAGAVPPYGRSKERLLLPAICTGAL